jgi:hypothetical protein
MVHQPKEPMDIFNRQKTDILTRLRQGVFQNVG